MLELISESIPEVFKKGRRGSVLYIYPSINGLLMDKFKESGFVIDALEPEYKSYHEAMLSGLYRMVINEEIKHYDPQVEHDVTIWFGIDNITQEELRRIETVSEDWTKLLILSFNKDSKFKEEDFIRRNYKTASKDNIIIVWRKNQ